MKMKSKRSEQEAQRKRHKEELADAKARRRGEQHIERSKPTIDEKPTILIVCEGANTEPGYFNQFRLTSATVKTVGAGCNTVSLVNQAQILSKNGHYNHVWCVFDKDDFPADDFNEAIRLASNLGFGVAYSNQAFEYWLILHFEDHQGGAMHRDQYGDKLNGYLNPLGCFYAAHGSKEITPDIFNHLMAKVPNIGKRRVDLAIARAERIFNDKDHRSSATEESSTKVYMLVRFLLNYV